MKLNHHFTEVLKNFATINSGMIFKPGNILRTMAASKTILAQAEVDVTFEKEFGIYDLNRMLALLSMNKDKEQEMIIEDQSLVFLGLGGRGKIRQRMTDPNLILAPVDPTATFVVPKYEVSFALNQEVFTWIFNVSSILKCPHTSIRGEIGKPLTLHALDVKGEIVDSAFVTLEGTQADRRFNVTLKNENIRVVSGEYDVEVSRAGFALFTNKAKKIKYWIALEKKSTSFEE